MNLQKKSAILAAGILFIIIAGTIIDNFLLRKGFGNDDVLILNGLPRHVGQAKAIDHLARPESLIVLKCSPDDIFGRIRENTGGDRSEQTDDCHDMVRKKLDIFERCTKPLIDYYSEINCNVLRIRVTASSTTENLYSGLKSLPEVFSYVFS